MRSAAIGRSFVGMDEDFPIAARGVYCQPYLVRGRREYYAVDSEGEQVASRMVPKGRDPKPWVADLWAELNEIDPIMPHDRGPVLRLTR